MDDKTIHLSTIEDSSIQGNERATQCIETTVENLYQLVMLIDGFGHQANEKFPLLLNRTRMGSHWCSHLKFSNANGRIQKNHAVIEKKGADWTIKTVSNKSCIYVNSRKVDDLWYLQEGDLIALSLEGPFLRFSVMPFACSSNCRLRLLRTWQSIPTAVRYILFFVLIFIISALITFQYLE